MQLGAKDRREAAAKHFTTAKFQEAATNFEKNAAWFYNAANKVKDTDSSNLQTIKTQFKAAAAKFGKTDGPATGHGAAVKFLQLANKKLPSLLKIYAPVLKTLSAEFKNSALNFMDKANAFSNHPQADTELVKKFQAAAQAFKSSADKFKEIGETIHAALNGFSNLATQANEFKEKAGQFTNQANQFQTAASSDATGKQNELEKIKIQFKTAGESFAASAIEFDNAIKIMDNATVYKFADNVKDLTDKAQAFQAQAGKDSDDGFLKKATTFGQEGSGGQANQFQAAAQAYGGGAECADASAAYKLKLFAQALVAAALQFKKFGESLATASEGSCDLLKANAKGFADAVKELKNQAEQFASAAGTFQGKAQGFRDAANGIPDITTAVTTENQTLTRASKVQDAIKIFKLAASVFGDPSTGAAKKFQAFANQLAQKAGESPNCYKLFGMIDELKAKAQTFKSAGEGFLQAAGTFSGSGTAEYFQAMATAFLGAADKLKDLAESMAAAYADTEVNDKAMAFRDKVVEFHRYAQGFETAAQLVTEQDDLTKVKESFATDTGKLVHTFGNTTEGAAAKLYDAFTAFADVLTSETCNKLQSKATKFKEAVDKQDKGFKHLANGFQRLASEINKNGELSGNKPAVAAIDKFKAAAGKFGDAGSESENTVAGKLSDLAQALHNKAGQNRCYKLLMHADKFQKASANFKVYAQLFQAEAAAFKAKATLFGTAPDPYTFREAATDFYNATAYLKTLADQLAVDLTGTPLSEKANGFRAQVDLFYNDSRLFYYLAQQVTKDSGLKENGIQTGFKAAAQEFSTAAEQFYKDNQGDDTVAGAFSEFNTALLAASANCQQLKEKAQEFTTAATEFQDQATTFNGKVQAIPDITVQVVTSVTLNSQPVSTEGTKTIKPSRVHTAISQFKLSADKLQNVINIFIKQSYR